MRFADRGRRTGNLVPLRLEAKALNLRTQIPIKEVILFGSYAQGNPKDYSDIDLAVISDWFKDKPKIENMQYLSRIAAAYNSLIEALPFTEEEYRN